MAIAGILVWIILVAIVVARLYLGKPTSVTVLEYQRGILYRRGRPTQEVGSGRHRVWAATEKVIILDMRPIPVSFESRAVTLMDGATAVYGISGTAEVGDVRKAIYSAQNYSHVPAFVLLCCARTVVGGYSSAGVNMGRLAITDEITKQAKERLASLGFTLSAFRLTQLTIAAQAPDPAGNWTVAPDA
jgi:regulator of protease activity HflC (stomatin/prohibitin superfamily)